jgi:transcriptional regulator with XRE-family HTH domain
VEDISKIFREAITHSLDKGEWGKKSQLAKKIGIAPSQLHDILIGRRYGTEEQRRALAAALGYPGRTYEDFLDIGRKLLAGEATELGTPPLSHAKMELIEDIKLLDDSQVMFFRSMLKALGKLSGQAQQSDSGINTQPGEIELQPDEGLIVVEAEAEVVFGESEPWTGIKKTIKGGNK